VFLKDLANVLITSHNPIVSLLVVENGRCRARLGKNG
jgi:hypothetical protein